MNDHQHTVCKCNHKVYIAVKDTPLFLNYTI